MKKKWLRFPVWIAAIALLFTLLAQTPGPVFAGAAPAGGIEIVSYTVLKGGPPGKPFTGAIRRGDVINIELTVFDSRLTDAGVTLPTTATASVNTASFRFSGTSPTAAISATTNGIYTLTFNRLTYTGDGSAFACNISYNPPDPLLPMQNVSLALNQCVPSDGTDTTPGTVMTSFVLKDASFGGGTIYAGEQFLLSATILTTNGTSAVENVSVTFTPPEQITLAGGSSVVYIGTMAPNTSRAVSVSLMASANIPEGSYQVFIDASGFNEGSTVGQQMSVSIPVLQPERFEIFDTQLPTDLTAGVDDGMGFSTVTLVNKGKGTVANVTIEVAGEGLRTDVGKQYLGNVAGGEQKVADFIMYADIPGVIEGYVVVNYENVRGEQMALERPFTVNVNEGWFEDPGFIAPEFPVEEPAATGPPVWLWIIIIAAAAVVAAALLVRRRKKKKAAAEAALDDLDDDD